MLAKPEIFLCTAAEGFALGSCVLGEAELLTIAVDPSQRRKGAGRRLLSAFEAQARRSGATRAFLEVSAENTAARALYESQGYEKMGNRRNYYRSPTGERIDAVIFSRALT